MKLVATISAALFLSVLTLCLPGAGAAEPGPSTESVKIPASQVHFGHTGVINHGQELTESNVFGDIKTGKHGTFMRFPSGFHSYVHTHTYDYFAVVVKGVITNPLQGEKGGDVPLPAGSYWFQKGGQPHSTNCVSKQDCEIFLVQMDGKFDAQVLEPVEPRDAVPPR